MSKRIAPYAKTADVNTTLNAYAKTTDVNTTLNAYAKTADVNTTLNVYAKTADMNNSITSAITTYDNMGDTSDNKGYTMLRNNQVMNYGSQQFNISNSPAQQFSLSFGFTRPFLNIPVYSLRFESQDIEPGVTCVVTDTSQHGMTVEINIPANVTVNQKLNWIAVGKAA